MVSWFKRVIYLYIFRYIKEWAEYKKTDAYKEFRKQQTEQKDACSSSKKIKQTTNVVNAGTDIGIHKNQLIIPTYE